ncbi:MAG: hypothetical protein LQ340_006676, partial [Diploschistes diacapsis]
MSVDPDYTPDFGLGMRAEIQQLYRPDDRSLWNESVPDKTATDVEAGSYAQECALIVRREPHPTTNQVALQSITVRSPLIKKVLDGTFKGFEGLNTQLKQLTFKAPFHPFYYRWHRFEKLREDEQDQETKDHLDLLYPILSEEIMPHIEAMKDLTKNKVINFDYLWTIFAPGMEVHTKLDGQDRLMELTDNRYGANMGGEFFTLECRYIDCDGSSFGYVSSSVDINKFEGVRKLVDLDAVPSHLLPDLESLVDRLHARGEKLEQLNGVSGEVESSRIIIDPHTFNIYGAPGPGLESIESDLHTDPADEDLLAGTHNVIYIATSQAFQEYRNALEKHEKRRKEDLSGGFAEEMRQPLYLMSASELGETAAEVEEPLEQVLELANKWNAILLLDECDMFLEARSTADIQRNRLVSIFLRQLEYYRGVMFLTSNRVNDFDTAFESRIHLTIHYPPLDIPSRLHVWKTFVQMGDLESQLSGMDLENLAKIEVNGRQIKNIVKTARLLSKQEKAPLAMEHIEMVLK